MGQEKGAVVQQTSKIDNGLMSAIMSIVWIDVTKVQSKNSLKSRG